MSSDEYIDDDDVSQDPYPRSSSLVLSNGSSLLDNSASYPNMNSNSLIAGMNNSGGTSLILQPNLSLKQQQDLRQKRKYTRRKNPEERKRRGPRAKDLNAPRMPLNGYVRFLNANRERVKQENPELSFADVTKKLAAEWSSMDPETKKSYLDEAEKEKEIYLKQLHEYQRSESYQEFMEMKQRAKLEQQQQKNLLNLMPTQNFSSSSFNQSHSSQQPNIYHNDQTSIQQNSHHSNTQYNTQHQQYSHMNNQSHTHTQSQHHSYGISPPSSSSSSLVYHNSNHGKFSLVKKGSSKLTSTNCTNSSPSNSSASSSNYQSYSLNNSQYYGGGGNKIHFHQTAVSNSPSFYIQKNKNSMIASTSMDTMPIQSTSLINRQMNNSSMIDPYRSFNTFSLSQSQTNHHINSTSGINISNQSNVEETNILEKMLEKLPPNSVIDLPIFTEEFLEHNKLREQELRNLRSFMLDYEETNAISSKHIDDMLKANEKLEKEEKTELETYNRLKNILDRLQQAIVEHLSGNISRIPQELIPKDNDNLEYGPVTLENLDKFMDTLLKVRKNFNQKYMNDNPSLLSIRQQFLSSIRTAITSMDEIII